MDVRQLIRREEFHHCFQPIYRLNDRRTIGYEALLRTDTQLNPQFVFQEAARRNALYDLDSRSLLKAVRTCREAGICDAEGSLFLNLYPTTLLNPGFPALIEPVAQVCADHRCGIVLEILEAENLEDYSMLRKRILDLKSRGFQIAIDDVGAGYSDFKRIVELEADYLKLDRYIAQDLHLSKQKMSILDLYLNYSTRNDCRLILEGLETRRELETAVAMGVQYGQGYLLGKPQILGHIAG